jgi:hypothetical protein
MTSFKTVQTFAAATILLAGCGLTEPNPGLPLGAEPMAATAEFDVWYAKTEACAGLSGSLQRVQWYVVKGVDTFDTGQGPKVGMWERSGAGSVIVVAGNFRNHEMVIRHEMLHSLIGQSGHPAEYFVERCGLTWETWSGD